MIDDVLKIARDSLRRTRSRSCGTSRKSGPRVLAGGCFGVNAYRIGRSPATCFRDWVASLRAFVRRRAEWPAGWENAQMPNNAAQLATQEDIGVPDSDLLSAKEIEQERKAIAEERAQLSWLKDSPKRLAKRIPVSVFAMGDLAAS